MDILELQKQIQTKLLTVATRVYFESASDDATFPYVVYNLPSSNELEGREDFILEVDIWDKAQDTTAIETLVGNIDTALNRYCIYIENTLSAKFYRESRLNLRDENKQIKRRQMRYIVQTYL